MSSVSDKHLKDYESFDTYTSRSPSEKKSRLDFIVLSSPSHRRSKSAEATLIIIWTGNSCVSYQSSLFLYHCLLLTNIPAKLINARTYEHRFAFHIETFARRRSELQSTITAYIAAGIDAANVGIIEIQDQLFNMDDKINSILYAFRTMDTPREREIHDFIESNGGPELCISKDDLLIKLLLKSGDTSISAKQAIVKGQDLVEIRQSLKAELDERLDVVMAANLPRFERLLNVQNNNFERLLDKIENQGYDISDHTTKLDKLVTTTISILEEERHIRKATAPVMSISFTDPVRFYLVNKIYLCD